MYAEKSRSELRCCIKWSVPRRGGAELRDAGSAHHRVPFRDETIDLGQQRAGKLPASAEPDVQPLLLLEALRLEATRWPGVAQAFGAWRQQVFDDDVAFHREAGLPEDRTELALLRFAIDGFMLDHLTVPLDTGVGVDEAVDEFGGRLLP